MIGTSERAADDGTVGAGEGAAWIEAARGHLLVFWGLAAGLVLFTGALTFRVLEGSRVPPHVIGTAMILLGIRSLRRGSPALCRPPLRMWIPAILLLYFSPFVTWWGERPQVGYFIANIMALSASAGWLLVEVCRAAERVGRARKFGDFAIEARLSAWLCGLMVAGPLAAMGALVALGMWRNGTSLYAEWFSVLYAVPRWLHAAAIVPFTIAMACAWRARAVCVDAVKRCARGPAEPAGGVTGGA